MALWTIDRCVIIGVCRSWEGKSVFARAPLLVCEFGLDRSKKALRVSGYPDAEHLEGDELTFEECDALVVQGEALQFNQIVPLRKAGTTCWILRFGGDEAEETPWWIFGELVRLDGLLVLPIRGPGNTFACVVDK